MIAVGQLALVLLDVRTLGQNVGLIGEYEVLRGVFLRRSTAVAIGVNQPPLLVFV